ncbi:manganese-dependent inorganic pyrophosphatase [Pediococcus acidilactici]
MTKQLIFGHSNPDTDAIVAAKTFAYYQTQMGVKDVEAVALGNPNPETEYVLNHFNEPAPRVVETVANEVDSVMLVDHNEKQQSAQDVDQVTVTAVVDHHRIANFETAQPLFYRAEPVGCTSTILTKMFKEAGIEIPAKIAGLMLSAIISDTLLLKSPTTTDDDRKAVETLAKIADVNVEEYGLAMLKAGTDLSSKSELELVDGDAKSFDMGGKKVRIGQVNTVDLDDVFAREDALVKTMEDENQKNGYDMFLLLATNILTSDSRLLVVGEPKEMVEKAFDVKLSDHNIADLPGVVSRKKQVVPPLMKAFE